MPKVYGLEVGDGRMASVARMLLTAHLFVIAICALFGIVQCAEHFAVQSAVEDYQAKAGKDDNVSSGALSGALAVIYKIGGPLVLPVLGFFVVRAGIQGNNSGILQGMCIMNGYCVGCTGCWVIQCIWAFIFMLEQKKWLEKGTCEQDGFYHPDTGMHEVEDYDRQDCTVAKDALHDLMGIWAVINILLAILCCCNVIACSMGTAKANEAHGALMQQQVFCGVPRMHANGLAQMPGQPGTIMVVGQPVGTQVPMGQPVGNNVPTPDPNAKVQS